MSALLPVEFHEADLWIFKIGAISDGNFVGSCMGTAVGDGIEVNLDGCIIGTGSQIDSL